MRPRVRSWPRRWASAASASNFRTSWIGNGAFGRHFHFRAAGGRLATQPIECLFQGDMAVEVVAPVPACAAQPLAFEQPFDAHHGPRPRLANGGERRRQIHARDEKERGHLARAGFETGLFGLEDPYLIRKSTHPTPPSMRRGLSPGCAGRRIDSALACSRRFKNINQNNGAGSLSQEIIPISVHTFALSRYKKIFLLSKEKASGGVDAGLARR